MANRLATLGVLLAAQRAVATSWPPVELNPSVLVLGTFDYSTYPGVPTSRCTDMVDRAIIRAGGTRLMWVPTIYWLSDRADKSDVTGYCYMDGVNGAPTCKPPTQAMIDEYRVGLQTCMQLASNKGINELAVVPHLDEASRLSAAWRNALVFSPTTRYAGFTYEEVLLNPVADALGAVVKPWTIIHFALQGEMSATVMRYPRQYLELIDRIRARIIAAAARQGIALPAAQVKVGLSFNYNAVLLGGLQLPATAQVQAASGPPGVVGRKLQQFGAVLGRLGVTRPVAPAAVTVLQPAAASLPVAITDGTLDVPAVQATLAACDFIGISAYAALTSADFSINELQNSAFTFMREFKAATSIDIDALMKERNIPLHYSEFGLGGGTAMDGTVKADTPMEAALHPFFGVYPKVYEADMDPWRQPQVRQFMVTFWRKAITWLAQGGGPSYPVGYVFMWTMGSYDVLAIYTESTTPAGTYFNDAVSRLLLAHNARTAAENTATAAAAAAENTAAKVITQDPGR